MHIFAVQKIAKEKKLSKFGENRSAGGMERLKIRRAPRGRAGRCGRKSVNRSIFRGVFSCVPDRAGSTFERQRQMVSSARSDI